MKGPKVVLIGAGSIFFGRQTIWSMVKKEALSNGTLALVDPDTEKLKWLGDIATKAITATGVGLSLELHTSHEDALKGADFVTLAFAVEGVKLRGVDAEISTRHGMIMCSADTAGPGGIMRTLREIPRQHAILKDVERICPDAWVINWVNPTAAMGIAMMRHHPNLKFIALCDGPHNPRFDDRLIVQAGLAPDAASITDALRSRVRIRSGGVNHFNWLIEMTCDGRDLVPAIKQKMRNDMQDIHRAAKEKEKVDLANQISVTLGDTLGYLPMCVWHTMEYLPYFQGHDLIKENALTIVKWKEEVRWGWMRECWEDMQKIASGERLQGFLDNTKPDHASDIIEAMWAGQRDKRFYINVPNNGAVTNMTDDAYLELPCTVSMTDVHALPFGPMPRPIVGFLHRVLDEHELAVEAAMTCDKDILRKAFLSAMTAVSLTDVEACMHEMLAAEKDYLPAGWYA